MSKKYDIEVTNTGAVYLNGTRITDRSTKWGIHLTMFKVTTYSKNITKVLAEHGYTNLRLDTDYMKEVGVK